MLSILVRTPFTHHSPRGPNRKIDDYSLFADIMLNHSYNLAATVSVELMRPLGQVSFLSPSPIEFLKLRFNGNRWSCTISKSAFFGNVGKTHLASQIRFMATHTPPDGSNKLFFQPRLLRFLNLNLAEIRGVLSFNYTFFIHHYISKKSHSPVE